MNGVDEARRHLVAARVLGRQAIACLGLASARAPQVAVVDVVVVRDRDAWPVARERSERTAPAIPLVQVVEQGAVGWRADDGREVALVDLITGEVEQVGIVMCDGVDEVGVWEPETVVIPAQATGEHLVAGERRDHGMIRVGGCAADRALVRAVDDLVGGDLDRLDDAEGDRVGSVPPVDPERRGSGIGVTGRGGDGHPGLVVRAPHLQCRLARVGWAEWEHLRRQGQRLVAEGVQRGDGRAFHSIGVSDDGVAVECPTLEPVPGPTMGHERHAAFDARGAHVMRDRDAVHPVVEVLDRQRELPAIFAAQPVEREEAGALRRDGLVDRALEIGEFTARVVGKPTADAP
jgi:hypothetical protein